jgi:hypothetical protein
MKIRSGFVSNSSSSSFVLIGSPIGVSSYAEYDELKDFFNDEIMADVVNSDINEVLGKYNLMIEDGENNYYIGTDPDISDDKKTIGEWKKEVLDNINKVLRVPIESVDIYADTSYNG